MDLGAFESGLEKDVWAEGLRYRVEAGVIRSSLSGVVGGRDGGMERAEGDDPEVEDPRMGKEREREVARMRKRLTDEFERRE